MRHFLAAAVSSALAFGATSALAQATPPADPGFGIAREPGFFGPDTQVTLGATAGFRPDYLGSDSTVGVVLPFVDANWRDRVFFTTRGGPELGFQITQDRAFRFGVGLDYAFGRDEGDNARLRGTGDIDGTMRARAFASSGFGPITISAFLAQDLLDNGHGLTVGGDVEWRSRVTPQVSIFAGPGLSFVDGENMRSFFGVTPAQAARSGGQLRAYDASGGLQNLRFSLGAVYTPTRNLLVLPRVTVVQLMGDAADSPITQQETQVIGTLTLAWRF
jgi:outer membrane scaffolding protein for murein synthesis (MipA/OmpV family)